MKVLISPEFGAGWSTWNSGEVAAYMRTYQPMIDILEAGKEIDNKLLEQFQKDCKEKFGKEEENFCVYVGGWEDLIVVNVEPPFKIGEYDGSEYIVKPGDSNDWVM